LFVRYGPIIDWYLLSMILACFVNSTVVSASTVFQEKKLKRKDKTTNPIILGPVYLHWDGAFHTYQRFFTHLASVIDTNISEALLSVNDIVVRSIDADY
jgi:hypothetical protein